MKQIYHKIKDTRFTLFYLLFFVISNSFGLLGQIVTPFNIRYQTQQKGGIRFLSNVSVTCNSSTNCTNAQNEFPPSGTGQNNSFTENYVDIEKPGYNGFFITSPINLEETDSFDYLAQDAESIRELKTAFTQSNKKRSISRAMVQKFVQGIAA